MPHSCVSCVYIKVPNGSDCWQCVKLLNSSAVSPAFLSHRVVVSTRATSSEAGVKNETGPSLQHLCSDATEIKYPDALCWASCHWFSMRTWWLHMWGAVQMSQEQPVSSTEDRIRTSASQCGDITGHMAQTTLELNSKMCLFTKLSLNCSISQLF